MRWLAWHHPNAAEWLTVCLGVVGLSAIPVGFWILEVNPKAAFYVALGGWFLNLLCRYQQGTIRLVERHRRMWAS